MDIEEILEFAKDIDLTKYPWHLIAVVPTNAYYTLFFLVKLTLQAIVL
jgi:hypothetical protein